jgi:hypothetical protein
MTEQLDSDDAAKLKMLHKHSVTYKYFFEQILPVIKGLRKRIETLESQPANTAPAVRWMGVYQDGRTYTEGELTTRGGSLWLATRATNKVPGTSESGWRLIVKGSK